MQTVHVRINDAATGQPTPVRVRFVGTDGTYYPPLGRLAHFATEVGEDVGCHLQIEPDKFAFVEGSFEIVLPSGEVTVEVRKGPEYRPIRQSVFLKPGQLSLRLAIERWANPRQEGWFSGDTDASFLSAHAALLEAAAEDLSVVNILAGLCGTETRHERIRNIAEFSGQRPALERPGHMVVVNTRNGGGDWGTVNLLNSHRPVFPLRIGSREGLVGYTVSDLCDQCHRKGGLVVWSDFEACWPSNPDDASRGGEAMAALILGKIDAVQTTLWPTSSFQAEVNWYDLLNCGVRIPLVGGSGKCSNSRALGDLRTYAQLPAGEAFSYKGWVEAVRAGRVYFTTGSLLRWTVEGKAPGSSVELPSGQKTVRVQGEAQSLAPSGRGEVVFNGEIVARFDAAFDGEVVIEESGWLAVRCGDRVGNPNDWQVPAAQGSPVYVRVGGQPMRPGLASMKRLMAFLDDQHNLAERSTTWENDRQRLHVLETMAAARQVLQRRTF